MIWHDDPCAESIPIAVEKSECLRHQVANFRMSQDTFTNALIQVPFDFASVVSLDRFDHFRTIVV